MPKLVGIPYYNAVKQGVDQAANELKADTTVIWQGPTTDQVDKQIEMLDNAISAKPSVIAVAAEAVKQMGLTGKIAIVGNSTPNAIRDYIKDGQIKSAVLWDPVAHGYLTVYTAHELATSGVSADKEFTAGHLGKFKPFNTDKGLQVLLGEPLHFQALWQCCGA
jgi:ABC-type sugar transport system substrate-binding protein